MAKTIIVTGASKGIGLAITKYITGQGHNVVIVARSKDLLDKIQDEHPKQVRVLAGDMQDLSIAQKAIDLAIKEFGRLDGVIINHGIMDPVVRIEHCNPHHWSSLFAVNLFSAVAFAKAAIPELRKSRGAIILTSSGVSTGAYSTWGAYGGSKAAMNHLARQLSVEEPEITSIAVRPGVVDTDMQKQLREVHSVIMAKKDNEKFLGLHQSGKLLKPEQPGHVMAKMALDPPKELNGQYVDWEGKELARFQ